MARDIVRGKDVNVYLVRDGAPSNWPILCAKSCTISRTYEIIETTNYTSVAKEFTTGMYEWGVSMTGIMIIEELALTTRILPFDLFNEGGLEPILIEFKDTAGNTKTLTGTVIIPQMEITADVNAPSGFSADFKGTGDFLIA